MNKFTVGNVLVAALVFVASYPVVNLLGTLVAIRLAVILGLGI